MQAPVSYTHLDVYKRQRVDSSIEWSQDSSEPVVEFKKSSRSAKEYIALAEEVMNRVSR